MSLSYPADGLKTTQNDPGEWWRRHAADLTRWVNDHLVVKRDRHGSYKPDGSQNTAGKLTDGILSRHFRATERAHVRGLHTTVIVDGQSMSKWLCADLDAHDGAGADPGRNFAYGCELMRRARALGLHPILEDSDGQGGLHFWIVFSRLVPTALVFAFLRWLTADSAEWGVTTIDLFPRQADIVGRGKECGNWVRIPGRHHKRDHWSRFWDDASGEWREGGEAVALLLAIEGDNPDLIPVDADPGPEAPQPEAIWEIRVPTPADPVSQWLRKALQNAAGRVATAPNGHRHKTLFGETMGAAGLLHYQAGFTEAELAAEMTEAGKRAEPGRDDHGATVADAITRGVAAPLRPEKLEALLAAAEKDQDQAEPVEADPAPVGPVPSRNGQTAPNEAEDDPHRLARIYLKIHYTHRDGLMLGYWNGEFTRWDLAYRDGSDKEIHAELGATCKAEFDRLNIRAIKAWKANGKKDRKGEPCDEPTARKVSNQLVGNVTLALAGYAKIDGKIRQPAWLTDNPPFPAVDVLPCRNALVYLPGIAEGKATTCPPTPAFFCPYVLDYDHDPAAECPAEWLRFLASLWPDDEASINTVQEWMGYLLTADTRQQKILMMIGPKRSGKGTIARVFGALLGAENIASPTLASLGTNFGLEPLIGKPAATITDARLSGRADIAQIVERLLSISGEDGQTIDRKFKPAVTVKLPTRFTLISNELPRFTEMSGALAGRMIILRLTRSFYGKEDLDLLRRLMLELPGILLWAIEGWKRLHTRGYFVQPESGKAMVEELEELTSPIGMFVKERCTVGPEHDVSIKTLFGAWQEWCKEKNREQVGDESAFGRNLRTVVPTLATKQVKTQSVHSRHFVGISLAIAF
jgi:putative DNA primase/helicase